MDANELRALQAPIKDRYKQSQQLLENRQNLVSCLLLLLVR